MRSLKAGPAAAWLFTPPLPPSLRLVFVAHDRFSVAGCTALQSLPHSVGDLTNLRELDLTACQSLPSLPPTIGGLCSLTNLQLPRCSALKELPDGLTALRKLRTLNAGERGRPCPPPIVTTVLCPPHVIPVSFN